MAKVSVSIPDELLERAHALHKEDNVSQLVQRGLALLAPKESQPHRPEWAKAGLAEVADRLRTAAREEYEEGYRTGFELAKLAPWGWMVWLDKKKFDLKRILAILWDAEYEPYPSAVRELEIAQWTSNDWPPEFYQALAKAFPAETAAPGAEECPARSGQFIAGVERALRDVWDYANEVTHQ